MVTDEAIHDFLSQYDAQVFRNALKAREIIFANLPNIAEQIDLPAKMIAYSYGQKYAELICTIIPSKKGLKLGFNRGVDLPDPDNVLEGTGKISRYINIRLEEQIKSAALTNLLASALVAYEQRMSTIKK